MTTRRSPPIAILGAGPSGLTLARLLKVNSIPYTIFDRDANPFASTTTTADPSDPTTSFTPPTLSNQGGSLDIHTETGQLALREAGLFDQFEAHARYDGQAFIGVDSAARDLARADPGPEERGRPEIDRPVLREILLRSVLEPTDREVLEGETRTGEVVWEKKVESVERCGEDGGASGWQVKFEDGSVTGPFELIVGADGTWSKTRKAITSTTPVYSGITYLQTCISKTNDIYARAEEQIGRGSYFAVTGGKTIFAQRQGDGSYNIYAGLRLPQDWNGDNGDVLASRAARESFIREEYADWASSLTDLILHSDAGRYHRWPIHSLAPEHSSWTHVPGLTLIGDAAHVAFVNGEGVNIGMFDGLQLARQIVRCGVDRLDEAVVAYETEMFVRGKENIEDGIEKEQFLYGEDAPRGFIEWLKAVGMC